jgi:outer membrane protein assembly factor BamB
VVGNRIYVSVADMTALGQSGRIYAFDADSGRIAWTGAPDGYEPTFSSPVVSGRYLVCGEGLHWAKRARLVCLDVETGRTLWTLRTQSHVECTPVISEDRVYVGAGDDGYYCADLKTGRLLWHLDGARYPDAETSLAVHDGKVYAGLGDGGSALCVIDAKTGSELRRVPMPYPVFGPPAISNGKLYIGMGKGDYIREGRGGEVRCLDLATLQTDWTFPLEMTVLGCVVAHGDSIYFASRDQHVYSIGRDGKKRASFNAHAPIGASPAVTERFIYVVTEQGMLHALNRETLDPVWEFRLGTQPLFISSPTIARGHAYVGTQNDGFLCVGEPGRSLPVARDNDGSPLPDAGAFVWNYPPEKQGGTERIVSGRSVAFEDGLYVPLRTGLVRIAIGAKTPSAAPAHEPPPPAPEPPIEIATTDTGDLVAQDRITQRELWRAAAGAIGPVTLSKDRFYVASATALECRSVTDGRILWRCDATPLPNVPPLATRGRLLFAAKDALLLVDLDHTDAKPKVWMDTSWLGPAYGPLALKNSRVYAPLSGWGIVCLGAAQ